MDYRKALLNLMAHLESKNSHGRNELKTKIEELKLEKSCFYKKIVNGNTSVGKNNAKFILLDCLIENLKD